MKRSIALSCCLVLFGSIAFAGVFPIATNPALVEFGGSVGLAGTNYVASVIIGSNVAGQLLTPNGQLLGSPIIAGANPGFPPASAMASARTNNLAAWTDYSISSGVTAFGRLLSSGGLGATFPLLASVGGYGSQAIQAAASDGTNFLVVWRDDSTRTHYGQRVSGSGALLGSEFPIFTMGGNGDRNVTLTFGRTNYLIAWQDDTGNGNQTYGALISLAGVVGSTFQISATPSLDRNPMASSFDGTNYLAVWDRATNYSVGNWPEWQLCARPVSQSGVVLGSEVVLVSEQASFPALAFDGANYLLAWGYDTSTTNTDQTIHAQFFDPSGKALGPICTPFSMQGTNPPLLPLEGVLFDGNRFLLTATFGSFITSPSGDVVGFSGGDVYGRFLPASTLQPIFTNSTATGGHFQGQLIVAPGMTYTIQVSTNLQNWDSVDTISSNGTNLLDLLDPRPASGQQFYRAVVGNAMPARYAFSFHEFAYAGGFGGGATPSVTFPVALNSYTANFNVEYDSSFPAASTVYFTGPAGCGLTNEPADSNNSFVDATSAEYPSPFVSDPTAAPGGTWTVNYRGTDHTFNVADPQANSHLVIPVPTVTLNAGVVQSVNWVYKDASTGAILGAPPAYVADVQVQIGASGGGRLYDSPWLSPDVTSHTLNSGVNWADVGTIFMAYDDSFGNQYVVSFSKP